MEDAADRIIFSDYQHTTPGCDTVSKTFSFMCKKGTYFNDWEPGRGPRPCNWDEKGNLDKRDNERTAKFRTVQLALTISVRCRRMPSKPPFFSLASLFQ